MSDAKQRKPNDPTIRAALEAVVRVQARDGRGPYRPGLTARWADPDGVDHPPIMVEFGMAWRSEIPAGWHAGCAFRDATQAARWFSPTECARLDALGFSLVMLTGCRVLRESERQLIVMRPLPLRMSPILLPWPHWEPARLDPWHLAALVAEAARDG